MSSRSHHESLRSTTTIGACSPINYPWAWTGPGTVPTTTEFASVRSCDAATGRTCCSCLRHHSNTQTCRDPINPAWTRCAEALGPSQSPHQLSSDMTCSPLDVHGVWMWCVNLVANGLVSCARPVIPRKVLAAHVLQVQGSVPAATACICMHQHHDQ